MSQQKQLLERPRSFSAKPANRARPVSGISMTNKMQIATFKTELLTSIYQGKQSSPRRKNTSKNLIFQCISSDNLGKPKKSVSKLIKKPKQQIYDENLQLKKQINKLSEELTIVKGKSEKTNRNKKLVEHNKQLDRQFEKQTFWTGSKSHMIVGIKHQYQKLKKEHQELIKENSQLKINLMKTNEPEYKIYAEEVEKENARLANKLAQALQEKQRLFKNNQSTNKQVSQIILFELENKNKILRQKINKLEQLQLENKKAIIDKDKKIQFLQKLLIQKDNNQYHLGIKLKKACKQKQKIQQNHNELEKEMLQMQKQYQYQLKQLSTKYQQQKGIVETKTKSAIRQKDQQIKSLEQENKQLKNTVTRLRISNSMVHANSNINQDSSYKMQNNSSVGKNKFNEGPESQRQNKNANTYRISQAYDSVNTKQFNEEKEYEDKFEYEGQMAHRFRVMQKADKKHSQNSKKSRKVQFTEIQQLGQILKYRMINYEITVDQMKQYFTRKSKSLNESDIGFVMDKKKQNENKKTNEQSEWDNEYICMAETQKILQSCPFSLEEEQAFLLARYIIQDCYEDYVYYDPGNQNTRDIVKSIIKALVGQYKIPTNQALNQTQQFLNNYETNFQSSLRTYYPSGKVTKKKFLDTLMGLGVQVNQSIQQILVAKVAAKSNNLQELQYRYIFQKHAIIPN